MQKLYKNMQVTTLKLEDRISHVKDWLLNSGIQSGEGGFYGWEDLESNGYSYLYSEITGYAITALCFLYEITKDDIYITRAKKAAKWIIDRAMHPGGGVLTRDYATAAVEHCSFERGNIYAFDCGTVAFGMLKLYRITKMREFLDAAKRIISFLEINMLKKNGLFYPIYDTKNKRTHQEDTKWSKQSGSFHCKLALCFCELADIEKNIAENLINASIENFFQNERFIPMPRTGAALFTRIVIQ